VDLMSGSFMVQPDRVLSTSQVFSSHQGTPAQLGEVLNGARAIDTGDPGLTGEIQALLGEFTAALSGLTAGLTRDALGLSQNAQKYQAADQAISQSFDRIRPSL
jgi:hypothetical protein